MLQRLPRIYAGIPMQRQRQSSRSIRLCQHLAQRTLSLVHDTLFAVSVSLLVSNVVVTALPQRRLVGQVHLTQ